MKSIITGITKHWRSTVSVCICGVLYLYAFECNNIWKYENIKISTISGGLKGLCIKKKHCQVLNYKHTLNAWCCSVLIWCEGLSKLKCFLVYNSCLVWTEMKVDTKPWFLHSELRSQSMLHHKHSSVFSMFI